MNKYDDMPTWLNAFVFTILAVGALVIAVGIGIGLP